MTKKEAIKKLKEAMGPSADSRRLMMLKLYGSNMVTNYKQILQNLDRDKPKGVKKAYKDFKSIISAIDKKMEEVL